MGSSIVKDKLHESILSCNKKLASEILDKHPELLDEICMPEETTPLAFAVTKNQVEMVRFLMSRKADADIKLHDGETAMLIASQLGHLESLQVLFGRHAETNDCDAEGNTALDLAVLGGHYHCAAFLYSKGMNLKNKELYEERLRSRGQEDVDIDSIYTKLLSIGQARKSLLEACQTKNEESEDLDIKNSNLFHEFRD